MTGAPAFPLFPRLTLIGCGLIGASLALAARRGGLVGEIVAVDRDPEVRDTVLARGIADRATEDLAEGIAGADLVILCTPVGTFGALAAAMAPSLSPGTIVSDVGSVKGKAIEAVAATLPENVAFVPAHPVAGTEKSGPAAGFAELFDGRWCILTPVPRTPPAATKRVTRFWEGCGARVDVMEPEHHDLVLAITSHIPHLIAYNIVGTAADLEQVTQGEVIKYSAGGFRDFTRIAASDPEMWRDIFLGNKEAVLEMLGRFSEDLSSLQRAIRWDDGEALYALFSRTRAIRKAIIDARQD